MSRRFVAAVSAVVAAVGLSVWGQGVANSAPAAGTAAGPATPEQSVTTRLADRREVAAGTRAYSIGFEDGRFYANGWHITGEMGGVWTPPLKLVDGVWFGLDGQWVGPATKFSSGWGYTRYDLPTHGGPAGCAHRLRPRRAPRRAVRPTITNPGAARTAKLSVDAHSELMGQYPWGFTGVTPNASDNLPDKGSFNGQNLVFTDDGALPGAPVHHYAALVGTSLSAGVGRDRRRSSGGRSPGTGAPAPSRARRPTPSPRRATTARSASGTGGELTYSLALPAGGSKTVWLGVAGFRPGPGDGPAASWPSCCTTRPRSWRAKIASRRAARAADPTLAARRPAGAERGRLGQAEPRRPHAERAEPADPLDQPGQAVPGAARHRAAGDAGSAPASRTTRGSSARTRSTRRSRPSRWGSSQPIEDHLRTLRDISDILNNRSGVVVHESVSDGSIWFGHDSQTANPDGTQDATTSTPTRRSSSRAPLRSSGGGPATTLPRRDVRLRRAQPAATSSTAWTPTTTAGPRARATWSAPGMGAGEARQRRLLHPRPVRPGRHGALQARRRDLRLGDEPRPQAAAALRQHLVVPAAPAVRRLADRPGQRRSPSRSTGSARRPWRPSCTSTGRPSRAGAVRPRQRRARRPGERLLQRHRRRSTRACSTPAAAAAPTGTGEKVIFGLTTSIQSVGEGNYGRLGPGPAAALHPRAGRDDVRRARDRRYAGRAAGRDAGDLPVAGPGREHRPLLDLPLDVHAGLGQLRHRLGGRAPVARRAARPGQRARRVRPAGAAGPDLGAGTGHPARRRIGRRARHAQRERLPHPDHRRPAWAPNHGGHRPHAPARHAARQSVVLDGRAVHNYQVVQTNRGNEVTVPTNAGHHTLTIIV